MRRLVFGLLLLTGCPSTTATSTDPPDKQSPQASAQPAALAVAPTTTPSATPAVIMPEGGPPPSPLRGDEVLSDSLSSSKESGYTLSALFRLSDLVGPPRAPEVNAAGLDAARKATENRVNVDLSPTRMRTTLAGRGFVLPAETEIRARSDRYGHVVVWPGLTTYRTLSPGSMRALLGERRFDVAPIAPAAISAREEGPRRIGIRTHKFEVTTRAGTGVFEIGKLDGAGEGGVLLCRMLLDLMNAPPTTTVCSADEVPVRVELRWTSRGSLVFELTGVLRRTDFPAGSLLAPPHGASFEPTPPPASGVTAMLSNAELAALRSNDVDVPPNPNAADALTLVNATDALRVLFLDGVPVAWAAPGAKGEVHGLRKGRYVAQWRTFFGDSSEAPVTQIVPGLSQVGGTPDAGK